MSERRGRGGGRGNSERRRRLVRVGVREREIGKDRDGESEREPRGRRGVARRGIGLTESATRRSRRWCGRVSALAASGHKVEDNLAPGGLGQQCEASWAAR